MLEADALEMAPIAIRASAKSVLFEIICSGRSVCVGQGIDSLLFCTHEYDWTKTALPA